MNQSFKFSSWYTWLGYYRESLAHKYVAAMVTVRMYARFYVPLILTLVNVAALVGWAKVVERALTGTCE